MMTPFNYKYQNPSGFACLMLIRAIVIFTTLGIQNLNIKYLNIAPISMGQAKPEGFWYLFSNGVIMQMSC